MYLAGGISGLSYDEATAWRNEAFNTLTSSGFSVLDPMRDKDCLSKEEFLSFDYRDRDEKLSPFAIFGRDIEDLNEADIIFARLDTAKSVGAPWEVGYSYAKRKKIILVVAEELESHPFVVGTTPHVYTDWKQALNTLINN